MGINQRGENMMGGHDNEFYNADTTLVISSGASYYDVLLDDYPNYEDSLRLHEKEYLDKLGSYSFLQKNSHEWVSKGRVDHSNPRNPPADCFIRKWLIRKDTEGRECDMELTIYYNDSISSRFDELLRCINSFPDK